jgi:ABC-type oligopeptide transport system ATPase subunit
VPKLDRLQQALNSNLTFDLELIFRRYDQDTPDAVDVLLVPPLPVNAMPVRFKRAIEKYAANVIWVRQSNEVMMAEPRHVPLLYCRETSTEEASQEDLSLSGLLPPSPSTISTFVGRLATIDKIFAWIKQSGEPRNFLYGKGGSGKTTIAYQIAKTLRLYGGAILLDGVDKVDNVVFISAKQTMIDVISGHQTKFTGIDFADERELYEAILTLSNWTSESLSDLDLNSLKGEMRELFDLTANVIVIDDIDTLTTKGLEAGFDFLYTLLIRAKKRSKILYTLRNAPSHSLANAIEVPGLEPGAEYNNFVSVCARQFKVPSPEQSFIDGKLSIISERRPLVVESIIAMRRTTSNYAEAIRLFEEGPGDDVRAYVFQREWMALPTDNFARNILAVMALYDAPLTFTDLVNLSRYDEGRVSDALSVTREMFLRLNEIGNETTFELGALTKAFILSQAKKLAHYENIKERVRQYKKTMYPENPVLTRLRNKIENLVERGRRYDPTFIEQAWTAISEETFPVSMTEDPRFLELKGYVGSSMNPPRLEDARRLFSDAFKLKHEPDAIHLRAWYRAENESGIGFDQCMLIAEYVAQGKKYSEYEKLEFLGRKGTALFMRAKEIGFGNPHEAADDFMAALKLHLMLYRKTTILNTYGNNRSEEYSINTAYQLFDFLIVNGNPEEFIDRALELCGTKEIVLDPLEDPLIRAVGMIGRLRLQKKFSARLKGRLEYLRREFGKSPWDDSGAKTRVDQAIERAIRNLTGTSL